MEIERREINSQLNKGGTMEERPDIKTKVIDWCNQIIFWGVTVLVISLPLVFNPRLLAAFSLPRITILRTITLIILSCWAVKTLESGKFTWRKSPLNVPILIFIFVSVIATLFSTNPYFSFFGQYMFHTRGLWATLIYAILYFVVIANLDVFRIRKIILIFLMVSGVAVIYGLLQHFGIEFVNWQTSSKERIWSSMGNPNFFAAFLVMAIPLSIVMLFEWRRQNKNKLSLKTGLLIALLCFQLLCLNFTYSRASWVGLFFGLAILAVLWRRPLRKMRKTFKYIILVLSLVILFVFTLKAIEIRRLALRNLEPLRSHGLISRTVKRLVSIVDLSEADAASRISGWKSALEMIKERPLLGMGPDTLSINFRRYMFPEFSRLTGKALANPGNAHNEVLQIAATMGIVGLLSYLWLLLSYFRTIVKSPDLHQNPIVVGIAASITAVLVNNLFSFHTVATATLFWLFLGFTTIWWAKQEGKKSIGISIPRGIKWGIYSMLIVLNLFLIVIFLRMYSADIHFPKGLFFQAKKRYDLAISEYRKAVKINPWEQTYYQNLAKIYQEVALLIQDETQRIKLLEESAAVYKKHLQLVPQDALSHNGLGVGYVHLAEQLSDQSYYRLAEESFQSSIQMAPYFLEPRINLGTVLYRLGKKEKALQSYDNALQVNPYASLIYLNLGNLYAQEGKMRKAIGYWQDALDLDPNLEEARRNIEMNRKFIE